MSQNMIRYEYIYLLSRLFNMGNWAIKLQSVSYKKEPIVTMFQNLWKLFLVECVSDLMHISESFCIVVTRIPNCCNLLVRDRPKHLSKRNFKLYWTKKLIGDWGRLPSELVLFESAATWYVYQMRSAPTANRTRDVGSVTCARYR